MLNSRGNTKGEEGLHPWGRTHMLAGKKCKEKGAAERSCEALITALIPYPPVILVGRR